MRGLGAHIGWLGLAALVAVAGCAPEKPSDAVAAEELEIEADDDDALEDSEAVVARIDGEEITREEFERRLNGLAEFARIRIQSADDREDFLGRIAEFELMADAAERGGYGTSAQVRHAIKETMVVLMVEDHLSDEVSIADIDEQARRAYFEANEEEFFRPERRRLARIFIEDEEEAQDLMQRWRAELEESEDVRTDFRRFAYFYSQDRSTGDDSGILGWFEEGEDNPHGEELFEWEPEVAIGPMEVEGGFAIDMVIGVEPEETPSFEELERELTERIFQKRRDQARDQLMEALTAEADVKVWDERIDELEDVAPSTKEVPTRLRDIPVESVDEE